MIDASAPSGPKIDNESAKPLRFSLRTMFAAVWVLGVGLATIDRDVVAALMAGLPIAWLGYAVISGHRVPVGRLTLLLAWGACGVFFCYVWPHLTCPFEIPSTARNLYVSNYGFLTAAHLEVRFTASVEDCVATAERVRKTFIDRYGANSSPPTAIDRAHGKLPRSLPMGATKKWWLTTDSIQKGLYYPGRLLV